MVYDKGEFVSNPGSNLRTIYSSKIMSDGSIVLKECGKEDSDVVIQSFKESTDIAYILAKLNAGDLSCLNQTPGMYGDFTQYPKTLADVLQLQIDSKKLFDSLPVDIKRSFDNDANKFFVSSGTKDWFDKISPVLGEDVKNVIYPPVSASDVVNNDVEVKE